MTLSSISNTGLPKPGISQQKNGADTDQIDRKKASASSGKSISSGQIDDDVTLNQVEKASGTAREINAEEAGELLPKTLQSILGNSKMAVSVQANTSPQTAQEILSSN